MWEKSWSVLVLIFRIGAIAFAGIVTLGVFLSSKEVITFNPDWEKYVWGSTLIIIAIDNVGTLSVRKFRKTKQQEIQDIDNQLMSLLIQLAKTKKVRFEELGASVYKPAKWRWWPYRADVVRLKRVRRFRPAGFPQQSGIAWTNLTGTVGECWRERKLTYWHGADLTQQFPETSISEIGVEEYASLPERVKQGFTLSEFKAIVGKYAEVIAVPIWDARAERKTIGLLTVDRATIRGEVSAKRLLTDTRTREATELVAKQLGAQLRSKHQD